MTELSNMTSMEKKKVLEEMLVIRLNITQPPSSTELCGVAGLYEALYSTVLTRSQLAGMGVEGMRSRIFGEIGKEVDDSKDEELLQEYHKCET